MRMLKVINSGWLPRITSLLVLLALLACGASATATPAPASGSSEPAQPQAASQAQSQPAPAAEPTKTPPAPTISAEVGQGAIGAVPTPVPTATPLAAAPEPVAAESKISLLKVARGVANNSSIDPALGGRGNFGWLEPMYEGLIHFDQYTDLRPMLATEWSTNDDFSVWTLQLREGVPFHKGWAG